MQIFFISFIGIITFLFSYNSFASNFQWSPQVSNTKSNLNNIFFIDENNGWIVGDNSTVLRTINSGQSWEKISIPYLINPLAQVTAVSFFNKNEGIITANNGLKSLILKTTNGGNDWIQMEAFTTRALTTITIFNDIIYIGGNNIILKSNDHGESWKIVFIKELNNVYFNKIQFIDSKIGFVSGTFASYKTFNSGDDWEIAPNFDMSQFLKLMVFSIHFFDENSFFGLGRLTNSLQDFGIKLKSTNGGKEWIRKDSINEFQNRFFKNLSFANSNTGWIVGSKGTILKSTNSGETWFNELNVTNLNDLNIVFTLNDSIAWIVGNSGIILKYTNTINPLNPIQPVLVSPLNQSYDNIPNTLFKWNRVQNATKYKLTLSINSDLSNPILNEEYLDTFKILKLDSSTVYYWAITAYNDFITSFQSEIWGFKTKLTSVDIYNNPDPFVLLKYQTNNTIKFTLPLQFCKNLNISIYTLQGEEIYNESYNDSNEFEIDISQYYLGVYFIIIDINGQRFTKKFTKFD